MRGMISQWRRDPEDWGFAMGIDFSEDFWTCCENRVLALWLLIRGGTELLEVLGTEGQDICRYPGAR